MEGDSARRIRERLDNQARDHWHEFSVIVASANTLLALALLGQIVVGAHPAPTVYVSSGIAVTSTLAAILAYYSIQVGALLLFGPLRLTQVLVSFLITASQLALFLWPMYVLSLGSTDERADLRGLRHWLLFYSLFSFAAVIANWHASAVRKAEIRGYDFSGFATDQRLDRLAAGLMGAAVLLCWALSFRWLLVPVGIGISVAAASALVGMATQVRTSKRLTRDLRS